MHFRKGTRNLKYKENNHFYNLFLCMKLNRFQGPPYPIFHWVVISSSKASHKTRLNNNGIVHLNASIFAFL